MSFLGSLFQLGPKTNSEWKHSIVKKSGVQGVRISVTLRSIATLHHPLTSSESGPEVEVQPEDSEIQNKQKRQRIKN